MNSYFQTPPVVKNLIIINALVYMATALIQPAHNAIMEYCALWLGAPLFHTYQFVTYMFVHANFEHIFFNMFALWMFGRTLEYELGSKRFLTYYMVCGIGAALIQYFTALAFGELPMSLVGASGAVMGLLLAFGVMPPNAVIMLLIPPIPMKAKWFVIIYGVIELFLGWRGVGNVAHFAHVGGMLWGFLLLHWWNPILWLAFRYMGRDMELACDQRTLDQLEPEQRKEYAKTLVELGAGRRLWEAPLCFGECDGALRVRAAVAWRPLTPVRRLTGLFCAALVFLLFAGAPAVPGGVTETDLSRNLTQMEEAPEKVVEELIRRLEEKGDLLSGVSIAAGWWKWEGTGGRIYLETSVGTWRAFRCVLGESGKMGMIQLRQEGRPHDLADCTQFYPVD